MKAPIEGVIPPGGFHFLDRSGGAEVRIEGDTYAKVAENVLYQRLRNSRPPGNPLQELYDYVCQTWPHMCRETETSQRDLAGEPLSSRMLTWLSNFQATSGLDDGTTQAEADRRAAICAGCPRNVQFYGCGSCGEHIRAQTFIYLRNRSTPDSDRLSACETLAEPPKLTVWSTKLKPLTAEQQTNVPENCWRKAI
jgi:hypothetical protein